MRVAILTDPPTAMRYPRREPPAFGGSYATVAGVRRVLEGHGHEVVVFIVLPDGGLTTEEELYEFATAKGLDLEAFGRGKPAAWMLNRYPCSFFVFALRTETLVQQYPEVIGAMHGLGNRPRVFVSAGPTARPMLQGVASKHGVEVQLLEKPGVTRITKKGLNIIVEALS